MQRDTCWTLEWTTHPADTLSIAHTGWRLAGRPHAIPHIGCGAAREIFHYAPQSQGRYQDDVMSLGAQTWLDSHMGLAPLQSTLTTALFSMMARIIERGEGSDHLLLDPTIASDETAHPLRECWGEIYRTTAREFQESFSQYAAPETWHSLLSNDSEKRAVDLIAKGYQGAAERWEDPAKARFAFQKIARAASHEGQPGDALLVRWNGQNFGLEELTAPKRVAAPNIA